MAAEKLYLSPPNKRGGGIAATYPFPVEKHGQTPKGYH